ncbi:MAG TPA: hypothetical protein VGO37_11755 [Steroidobacteraceae bacterium]|jgi:hypothetical protein|nr:hypothetical protein [Steroidobacteraceae bacterium]
MNRLLTGIALAGVVFASPIFAVESANQSNPNKKQMAGCMTKRMLADRAISYNDAKKVCTDQLKQSAGTALNRPAGALTAATSPRLAR